MPAQLTFRSGADRLDGDGLAVKARKRRHEVTVRFAQAPGSVATREGPVPYVSGDAIVTGGAGEQWPVARARFVTKYEPVPPTRAFADGRYRSLPQQVWARQVAAPFGVVLADGVAVLCGQTGDWLIDYGDGALGVVAQDLFFSFYQLTED